MQDSKSIIDSQNTLSSIYQDRIVPLLRYLRRNPILIIGLAILLSIVFFVAIGYLFYDTSKAALGSYGLGLSPSFANPLGTDQQGRDVLALMIVGIPITLRIGLIASIIGVSVGLIFGLVSGYFTGLTDTTIRTVVDVLVTIPSLLVLILIVVSVPQGSLTFDQIALIIASLAWLWPTRTIRSQVLVMRQQAFVSIARLSGSSSLEIIFREMMPNLAPYIFASFVNALAAAMLASIGLEALGLGQDLSTATPSLGLTIYSNIWYSSILLGLWWWFVPPIIIMVMIFVGLFMVTSGLDEIANPRLRRRV